MIIQNLHNIYRNKKQEVRDKTFLSLFLLFFPLLSVIAQDSIPLSVGITDKNNTNFQENFFKALSYKAILNHQKAIEHLEKCNELAPKNKAVLFELSKNYSKLNRNTEALEFITSALNIDAENLWLLEHKVSVLKRLAFFDEAIIVQQKIAKNHPKKKQQLVFLHLQNGDATAAKEVLAELKEAKLLNNRLRRIEERLYKKRLQKVDKPKKEIANTNLRAAFEKEKSFTSLKLLLTELSVNNSTNLLKYTEQGLSLFPAQPYVYLLNGLALNNKKDYEKALQSLQNGIDFVIDNTQIEARFYLEMARAYQGLNDIKKANSFKNKAAKISK